MEEVITAKFKITGYVNVIGANGEVDGAEQYPVGSVQELPIEYGSKSVDLGNAELVEEAVGETGDTAGQDDEAGEAGTGATGEMDE